MALATPASCVRVSTRFDPSYYQDASSYCQHNLLLCESFTTWPYTTYISKCSRWAEACLKMAIFTRIMLAKTSSIFAPMYVLKLPFRSTGYQY